MRTAFHACLLVRLTRDFLPARGAMLDKRLGWDFLQDDAVPFRSGSRVSKDLVARVLPSSGCLPLRRIDEATDRELQF